MDQWKIEDYFHFKCNSQVSWHLKSISASQHMYLSISAHKDEKLGQQTAIGSDSFPQIRPKVWPQLEDDCSLRRSVRSSQSPGCFHL